MIRYIQIDGCNIGAIKAFFKKIDVEISKFDISKYNSEIILIPGVGNCKHHIKTLNDNGISSNFLKGKPIISICAGMQVLCNYIEESHSRGLALLNFDVECISGDDKIVNTGLNISSDGNKYFFNHSFGVIDKPHHGYEVFNSEFLGQKFISHVVNKKELHCQFHPELSGKTGRDIVKKFISNIGA